MSESKHRHAHRDSICQAAETDEAEALSAFFKLFADKTRLQILLALYQSPQCGCDLAKALGMTKSAVSHQLALLKRGHLVTYKKEGKHAIYRLSDEHVFQMIAPALTHVREC